MFLKPFREVDYDPEDLVEKKWSAEEKWQVLQRAPAFIQCEPTPDMKYETGRLIISRLAGDVGDEGLGSPMVVAACKAVAGVMCETHKLSHGGSVLE